MVKRRKDSGFTLIELMIVIAVIGILAVVLVPKFGSVKTDAKLAGVQTNFRSVTTAISALKSSDSADTKLQAQFGNGTFVDGDMKNPIVTTASGVSNTVDLTSNPTAAVYVLPSTATVPSTTFQAGYKGAVVAILQADGISYKVYGCDENGKSISDLVQPVSR
ncbi:hypothetical protein DESME_10660 [Desulfitobacterium metallireducens DSM 15288]|uniref:Prepilin-type N-terminal cleavage/methylation domain-containing protein n=2 Tax=Desulfitobacterium TaxID=36853 RepID=W0EED5_9FIRM|nr:hypothetical protein DESME_10660 [Desulfitobacterium metallireducens DSM 15288]